MNELQMPQFFDKHFFIVLTQNELYLQQESGIHGELCLLRQSC